PVSQAVEVEPVMETAAAEVTPPAVDLPVATSAVVTPERVTVTPPAAPPVPVAVEPTAKPTKAAVAAPAQAAVAAAPAIAVPVEPPEPENEVNPECPACGDAHSRLLFEATDRLYRTTDKVFQILECK